MCDWHPQSEKLHDDLGIHSDLILGVSVRAKGSASGCACQSTECKNLRRARCARDLGRLRCREVLHRRNKHAPRPRRSCLAPAQRRRRQPLRPPSAIIRTAQTCRIGSYPTTTTNSPSSASISRLRMTLTELKDLEVPQSLRLPCACSGSKQPAPWSSARHASAHGELALRATRPWMRRRPE
jgi:hypothetical protein